MSIESTCREFQFAINNKISNEFDKDIELFRECEERLNEVVEEIDRVNCRREVDKDYLFNLEQENELWWSRKNDKKDDIINKIAENDHIFDELIDLYEG